MTVQASAARSQGRPRDPAADQAILAATRALLVQQGYDRLSIEAVAAAAKVGKSTIYRRYRSKRELVVAAISTLVASIEPPADTGDTRRMLEDLVVRTFAVMQRDGLAFSLIGTLLVKEREDPELVAQFRERVLAPRMLVVAEMLHRGIERGHIRPDVSIETTTQMVAGSILARHVTGQVADEAWLKQMFEQVWRGIAAPGAPS